MSSHVVEHLQNPKEHIQNIKEMLKDEGVAYLETPNLSSADALKMKDKWRGYIDPTHINLMTIKQVRELCLSERLQIIKCGTSLYFRSPWEMISLLRGFEFTFRSSGQGDACSFLLKKLN